MLDNIKINNAGNSLIFKCKPGHDLDCFTLTISGTQSMQIKAKSSLGDGGSREACRVVVPIQAREARLNQQCIGNPINR